MTIPTRTVKTLALSPTAARVGGYGVIFGGQDLQGETFSAETDFKLHWNPQPVVLYDHTLNEPQHELGTVVAVRKDAYGLFIEAELDRSRQYTEAVLHLINQGVVGYSTGSSPHLVRYEGTKIIQWPIVEVSLTVSPADPRTVGVQEQLIIKKKGGTPMYDEPLTSEPTTEPTATYPADVDHLLARMNELETSIKALHNAPALPTGGYIIGGQMEHDGESRAVKAFDLFLRTGERRALKAGLGEYSDAGVATPTEGGYLVPTVYSNELITSLKDQSILRQAGARMVVASTHSFKVPTMTQSTAAVLTNDEAAFSTVEPSFGEIEFNPYKYTKLVKVSDELLMDSRVSIMSQVLIPDFVQAFAAAENAAFTTGTGSGQPGGVITGATAHDIDTHTAPTADNIIDLYHQLPYLYRQNAVWMMHDTILSGIRKLTSGVTGDYLWQPGMNEGQPDRLLGRPVYTNNSMASTTTDGSKIILFGDMSYFWIVDFGMESMVRLNELYAGTGQVGFRMFKRLDSAVMLADAFRVLQV